MKKSEKQLMIGGQALRQLGSSRSTEDTDYLIYEPAVSRTFIHDKGGNIDYCNAAANAFFGQVWEMEKDNQGPIASPQALFELKLYAWVQHFCNGFWNKEFDARYDLEFIMRKFPHVTESKVAVWHLNPGQQSEAVKLVNETKQRVYRLPNE